MNILKELVLAKGCDPWNWTADERREAVLELYQHDLTGNWMADALADLYMNRKESEALLSALAHDNAAMRHQAIGIIVERALLNFPLDYLQKQAEEMTWRATA